VEVTFESPRADRTLANGLATDDDEEDGTGRRWFNSRPCTELPGAGGKMPIGLPDPKGGRDEFGVNVLPEKPALMLGVPAGVPAAFAFGVAPLSAMSLTWHIRGEAWNDPPAAAWPLDVGRNDNEAFECTAGDRPPPPPLWKAEKEEPMERNDPTLLAGDWRERVWNAFRTSRFGVCCSDDALDDGQQMVVNRSAWVWLRIGVLGFGASMPKTAVRSSSSSMPLFPMAATLAAAPAATLLESLFWLNGVEIVEEDGEAATSVLPLPLLAKEARGA